MSQQPQKLHEIVNADSLVEAPLHFSLEDYSGKYCLFAYSLYQIISHQPSSKDTL